MDTMSLVIINNEVNLPPSILDRLLDEFTTEPSLLNTLELKQQDKSDLKQQDKELKQSDKELKQQDKELKQPDKATFRQSNKFDKVEFYLNNFNLNNVKEYKPTSLELFTLLGCKNLYQDRDLCNAMNWILSFVFIITNEYNKYIFNIGEYASLPHTHENYNNYWLFTQEFLNNLHSMVKNKTDKNETQGFIFQLSLNNTCSDFQDALQKTIKFNIVDYLSLGTTPKNKFNLSQEYNINPIVKQNSIVKPNQIHSSIVKVFHNYLFPIVNLISDHLICNINSINLHILYKTNLLTTVNIIKYGIKSINVHTNNHLIYELFC